LRHRSFAGGKFGKAAVEKAPVAAGSTRPHCAWVESELYCQLHCQVCTSHGHLRHAVFPGLLE
jgi:hypothetical protein